MPPLQRLAHPSTFDIHPAAARLRRQHQSQPTPPRQNTPLDVTSPHLITQTSTSDAGSQRRPRNSTLPPPCWQRHQMDSHLPSDVQPSVPSQPIFNSTKSGLSTIEPILRSWYEAGYQLGRSHAMKLKSTSSVPAVNSY
ncbi:unnamed protein product [Schistosoma margrebowiei]|uniref:Uncharacterized protein n=1 Tax=Schistosoma margrebowiei TaxID=48269 RepID=A0A183MA96_9TREM|nr:unnamed protein product [Schistosoma margrebowiei]